jgi:SAM-dependent methyltransferase
MARDLAGTGESAGNKTSPRLAIACVADAKHKYLFEALRLAHALSSNTALRDFSDLYIGVFPDARFGKFIELFHELGANIIWLSQRSDDHGPSNKLQILTDPALKSYDYVTLVDCDMLPVKPFPELLDFDGVQAKIADLNTLDCSRLSGVFDLLGMPMPSPRWNTSLDRVVTTCYCNTGCIVFSQSILEEFVARWIHYNDVLRANKAVLGDRVYFLDQASFCACVSTFIDRFRPLPLSMNFPGHMPGERYPENTLAIEPQWLHYHNKVDYRTAELDLTVLPNVQKTVAASNQQSASFRKALRETPLFWNVFYGAQSELCAFAERHPEAHSLVRCVINSLEPESILDLGCGTFSPDTLNPSMRYVGIDWSAEAVRNARRKFPRYSYELANIREAKAPARADLVMMLDVIGPEACASNRGLLAHALALANRGILVSTTAPDWHSRDQAWQIFLDQLETVSTGFRVLGNVGTELFVLKTQ